MSRRYEGLEAMALMAHRAMAEADPEAPAGMNGFDMWGFLAEVYTRYADEPAARHLAAHYTELRDRYDTTVGRRVPPTYNTYDVFLRASVMAHATALGNAGPVGWLRHRFTRKRPPWCRCFLTGAPIPLPLPSGEADLYPWLKQ